MVHSRQEGSNETYRDGAAWKRGPGRPKVETPKVHVGFRLAADVVEGIRATGKGFNARVENVLREALAAGKLDMPDTLHDSKIDQPRSGETLTHSDV